MMGHTHILIGLGAGLLVAAAASAAPGDAVALVAVAGASALMPDIDHPGGLIRGRLGVVGHVGLFWLSHRGLTHTLAVWGLLTLAALVWLPVPLAAALAAGYGSHILADMLTRAGLPVLWPVSSRSFHLLPRLLRVKTGGFIEAVIGAAVLAALMFGVYGLGLFF